MNIVDKIQKIYKKLYKEIHTRSPKRLNENLYYRLRKFLRALIIYGAATGTIALCMFGIDNETGIIIHEVCLAAGILAFIPVMIMLLLYIGHAAQYCKK